MDKNGQLTFSDDPILHGFNEALFLIEQGEFNSAVSKIDELLTINPDYPGLIEAYRTAKFWENRKSDFDKLPEGKKTADFFMKQWEAFDEYAEEKKMKSSTAYNAAMKLIFYKASEHYKISFKQPEESADNFGLLLNLGDCFLRLKEYQNAIDTLEYARTSYKSNARLLAILAEAYFYINEIPKSLLYFREAFLVDPSEIDLNMISAKPITDVIEIINKTGKKFKDIKEWIPVYAFISDIFYVRRNLSKHQIEIIKEDIYQLEINFQKMSEEQLENTNITPRLINKYLWMLDYYEFQNYNFENLSQIRERLIAIDKNLFMTYFKNK